jgi:hypothetical protein
VEDFRASQRVKCGMGTSSHFKHVNGGNGKVESICMKCLLAVGICSSDEELATKERQHDCKSKVGEMVPSVLEVADRPKSKSIWTWNKFLAILPRRRPTHCYWTGTHDE